MKHLIIVCLTLSFGFSADVTVWLSDINTDYNQVGISVSNLQEIAGFQFTVAPVESGTGLSMVATSGDGEDAVGGVAGEQDFTVHRNETGLMLGYSLSGNLIPITEEGQSQVLVYTVYTGDAVSIADFEIILLETGHSFCDEDANVLTSETGNLANDNPAQISEFRLGRNFPNPFNPETVIEYDVAKPGIVELTVYNMMGQEIAWLVNGYHTSDSYTVTWGGANANGEKVASGMYLYKMTAGDFIQTNKMLLLK